MSESSENSWSNAIPEGIAREVVRWRSVDAAAAAIAKLRPLGVGAVELGVVDLAPGDAVLVAIEASDDAADARVTSAAIARLGPLPAKTLVFVAGATVAASGWRRWLGARSTAPSRAVVGSALLGAGIGDIGAGRDAAAGLDLVWGRARDA